MTVPAATNWWTLAGDKIRNLKTAIKKLVVVVSMSAIWIYAPKTSRRFHERMHDADIKKIGKLLFFLFYHNKTLETDFDKRQNPKMTPIMQCIKIYISNNLFN